jgi:signal transduction histidine kinase
VKDLEKRLAEARNQQAATAEILRVISSSPTDVAPVFAAIVRSAVRLCGGTISSLYRYDGRLIHFAVTSHPSGFPPQIAGQFPRPADASSLIGRAILDRIVVNVADMATDPRANPGIGRVAAAALGFRSMVVVPMSRERQVVGVITVGRASPGAFSEADLALLQTFADQAVIAIENVRLFNELEARNRDLTEALEQQTATSEILRVLSSSPADVQPVFMAIANSAARLCEAFDAIVLRVEGDVLRLVAHYGPMPAGDVPLHRGTLGGRTVIERRRFHIEDLQAEVHEFPQGSAIARERGHRTTLSVPLLREGVAIGNIQVRRNEVRPFSDQHIALLETFADQAVIAIENVRLFKELESANRSLEAASRHKSEFLANMSHELRTPLNAIIGFSEALTERMFGELNEKQDEYLRDIYASGQHLLSLINDILDLSKIEAGRMELHLTEFDLPQAIDNAVTLVRDRAARRGIALHQMVDPRLGPIRGDERKIKQVLLNLLSNALKFTPEGGRVGVRATVTDGQAAVSVTDTGVGIAPEDQDAVFEEFRQVGPADKKVEGTGLGLALSRRFIELHGGKIRVESQVGRGSTFTFTLPLRSPQAP